MGIEEDLVRLTSLEETIEFNEKVLARVRARLREWDPREKFGVLDPERRAELLKELEFITERLKSRIVEYDKLLSIAGKDPIDP